MDAPQRRGSPPMTPLRAAIARFLVLKLGFYQHQAAAILGVNQGRISEAINDKQGAERPPKAQLTFNFDL